MKILAVSASLRKESLNRKLVLLAAEIAANLEPLRIQIAGHDALIISSPEYNFSMPGHFKNTFDWLSRAKPQPWKGKIVQLLSASPSLVGGNRGLWSLRIPFEGVGAVVHPDMFSLAAAHEAFDSRGKLTDSKAYERLTAAIDTFVTFAQALTR
jgi:chromate reductase